jgi:hypothetical protein
VTADLSARGRSNRRRGADAERKVAIWLRVNGWPDARRYLSGDGMQPGDLDWHPLVVAEVKDCAASAWPTWQRQALAACKPGQACMVIRRYRGDADPGRWTVRVHLRSWLEVIRGEDATDVDPAEWVPMTLAMAAADVRRVDEVSS